MTPRKNIAYFMMLIMVLSFLPHTYYAASSNHISRVLTVMEGECITADEAPILNLVLKDELEQNAIFYIELSGGKWLNESYKGSIKNNLGQGDLEIRVIQAQKLQVKVKGGSLLAGSTLQIPMALQMTGHTATIEVKNNNTVVSGGTYLVARAENYKGHVTAQEIPTTTHSGIMATLRIEEPFSKAFSKAVTLGKKNVIELRLNHNAYAFSLADSVVELAYEEGFEDFVDDNFSIRQIDPQTLHLTLPDTSAARYTGAFSLSGIFIQLTDKKVVADELTVTLSGDLIETTTLPVLEVMDYAITLQAESQRVRAGSKQTVTLTLKEEVEDSLIRNRPTYFTFSEGINCPVVDGKVAVTVNGQLGYYPTIVENDEVIGFEISRLPEESKLYQIQTEVIVLPTTAGDIKVTADGRSLVEELDVNILEVYQPFEIKIQSFQAMVGVKDQTGGEVILKETSPGEFIQGESIILELEESNMKYSQLPQIKVVSGDVRLGDAVRVGTQIAIPVVRSSHIASTVSIKDFCVTVDQTTASGNYTLQIGGGAFTTLATEGALMPVASDTLIQVRTVSTIMPESPDDEVSEEAHPRRTAIFTLGQTTYQIGERIYTMDAAPYVSNGRTMLPIKYVSEALGISAGDIVWNNSSKTVTIHAGQRITLTLGSNIMMIDGEKVMMSTVPEVQNGRTCVPVAEIARALKVTTKWDNINKQVMFIM